MHEHGLAPGVPMPFVAILVGTVLAGLTASMQADHHAVEGLTLTNRDSTRFA